MTHIEAAGAPRDVSCERQCCSGVTTTIVVIGDARKTTSGQNRAFPENLCSTLRA
jgi:hypothetical protein